MFNENYLKEIGSRLRKLRKREKLTQPKLFSKLEQIRFGVDISKDDKVNDKYRGKQFISNLENGKYESGLSIDYALAYCKLCNVSLDYIYFGTESYKPEYDDIKKLIGLSDDSLNLLEKTKDKDKKFLLVLNKFLEPELSLDFINLLHSYYDFYNLAVKEKAISNAFLEHGRSRGLIVEDEDKFFHPFYPKERIYTSLYTISTESTELANKFKKLGGKK